jgi:hypothetical protein
MRHGLIRWDEESLLLAEIEVRQQRLLAAIGEAGLDALLIYTNHVRSAGVTWSTGFTPYWSDGLWLLPRDGRPLFATALSRRVGNWIVATNPSSEIGHSPRPGELVGKRLTDAVAVRLGVVELDRLPAGLATEIRSASSVELVDATALFATVRTGDDAAEPRLMRAAAEESEAALAAIPAQRSIVGDVTLAVELRARLGGAEEVYMAVAPDLAADMRFARVNSATPLGERFAVRCTLARHGVWLRMIRTYARDGADDEIDAANAWFAALCHDIDAGAPIAEAIVTKALPDGLAMTRWFVEAPGVTRPLQVVADAADVAGVGNLTVLLSGRDGQFVLGGPIHKGQPA